MLCILIGAIKALSYKIISLATKCLTTLAQKMEMTLQHNLSRERQQNNN